MKQLVAATVAWLAAIAIPAHAQSVETFYKGKTVSLVIGFSVGGGYDLYARHLARHIGKHIPGNPAIVPQNMPGAGSLKAANFIYTAAPKDGTAFGTFARTTGINPLLESGATFDGTKFIARNGSWLMLRGSGTEPVLRIYAEASTGEGVRRLITAGKRLVRVL